MADNVTDSTSAKVGDFVKDGRAASTSSLASGRVMPAAALPGQLDPVYEAKARILNAAVSTPASLPDWAC